MSNIAVILTQANRIRALAAAEPRLSPGLLARRFELQPHLVEIALRQSDVRRVKSVAR